MQALCIILAAIITACQTCWCPLLPLWLQKHPPLSAALAGRLVTEAFEELLPVEARHFITRYQPGSADSFQGTQVHRLV